MTGSRRQRSFLRPAALAALLLIAAADPAPVTAATTERIVSDHHTGIAINGFDPVAYFTDAEPKPGNAELEYKWEGVTWRFRNEGNRAAFVADPDIYMPRFGGYDPIAVARGVGTAGHPELWLVFEQRLYFFYNTQARDEFTAAPEEAIEAANARWEEVLRKLVP